jgi:hypothetical protein
VLGLNQWALGILIAALVASACYVKGCSDGRAHATHVMQARVDEANRKAEAETNRRSAGRDRVDNDLAQSLSAVDRKFDRVQLPALRVCDVPRGVEVSRDPDPAGSHDAAPGGDGLSRDVSQDIAAGILKPAEQQTAQLIACQAYVRELTRSR